MACRGLPAGVAWGLPRHVRRVRGGGGAAAIKVPLLVEGAPGWRAARGRPSFRAARAGGGM
eukprot:7711293-Lingulodinium_polyedra.AAC.1